MLATLAKRAHRRWGSAFCQEYAWFYNSGYFGLRKGLETMDKSNPGWYPFIYNHINNGILQEIRKYCHGSPHLSKRGHEGTAPDISSDGGFLFSDGECAIEVIAISDFWTEVSLHVTTLELQMLRLRFVDGLTRPNAAKVQHMTDRQAVALMAGIKSRLVGLELFGALFKHLET